MSSEYIQYLPPLPQEGYQQTGLISAVVGFIILAYFFMYFPLTQLSRRIQIAFAFARVSVGSDSFRTDRNWYLLPGPQCRNLYVMNIMIASRYHHKHHQLYLLSNNQEND